MKYCKNCKYYLGKEPIHPNSMLKSFCDAHNEVEPQVNRNKNLDCKFYVRIWWKFWASRVCLKKGEPDDEVYTLW